MNDRKSSKYIKEDAEFNMALGWLAAAAAAIATWAGIA